VPCLRGLGGGGLGDVWSSFLLAQAPAGLRSMLVELGSWDVPWGLSRPAVSDRMMVTEASGLCMVLGCRQGRMLASACMHGS
jgi:hypothetical protein